MAGSKKVRIGAHVSERQVAGRVVKSNHCPGGKHNCDKASLKARKEVK